MRVRVGERRRDVGCDPLRLALTKRPHVQPLRERAAADVLVDRVRLAVFLALVEELDDGRMHEPGTHELSGGHANEDIALELGVGRTPARGPELLVQVVPSADPAPPHAGCVPQLGSD
jgi:hypothetical protein